MTAYAEVIGDPIAQSKSPAIHGYWLGKLGLEADYRACHVTADGLADYLAERSADADWRGCNVTMPHKQAVIAHLDRLEPRAAVSCHERRIQHAWRENIGRNGSSGSISPRVGEMSGKTEGGTRISKRQRHSSLTGWSMAPQKHFKKTKNQAAMAWLVKIVVRILRSNGFSRKSLAPARLPVIIVLRSASMTQ